MKTIFLKPREVERKWYLVDAENKTLGRLAAKVATLLRGKHKPIYSPHMETGDYVIIVNAEKVAVTGRKREHKLYRHHTGFLGGLKEETLGSLLSRKPVYPLEQAIWGMLPKGAMGRKLFKNVKIYSGPDHPHAAQQPVRIDL